MAASLRALLSGVFDYAGMYPPAKLPLEETLDNYLRYRQSGDSWMLGALVVPAARLGDLAAALHAVDDGGSPLPLSIVGQDYLDDEWLEHVAALISATGAQISYETRLPAQAVDQVEEEPAQFAASLRAYLGRLWQADARIKNVFLEPSPSDALPALARIVGEIGRANGTSLPTLGLKLRAGGLAAHDFPTSEGLRRFIVACHDHDIRWKATAGLHHPLRQFREEVGTKMHGFVNLLAATVLAEVASATAADIDALLDEESAASFRFDDDAIRWRDFVLPVEQIRSARHRRLTSIGSCSFDEPREDLQALGWWSDTSIKRIVRR